MIDVQYGSSYDVQDGTSSIVLVVQGAVLTAINLTEEPP